MRGLMVLTVLILVLIGLGIWGARALPRIATARISRMTNAAVEMGAFRFHPNGSVSIDGLVVHARSGLPAGDDAILRAKTIHAQFSPGSLLRLSPRLTEIRIEDFIFDVQVDLDTGQWNLGGLRIRPSHGGSAAGAVPPKIVLRQGRLRHSRTSAGKTEIVTSIPIEVKFGPAQLPERGYAFEIKTAKLSGGYGESHLSGYWRPGELALAGGLSSTDIPSLERAWAADVLAAELKYDSNGDYSLDFRVKNARNKYSLETGALRSLMPADLREAGPLATVERFFARYRPSGTVGQVTLTARGNFKTLGASEIAGEVVCDDVSICDARFPYEIHHLTGRIGLSQSSVVLNRLTGKHDNVDLVIEGWTKGYGADRRYQYRVTSDNMVLDQSLYGALEPGQKRLWDAFKPVGTIGVDYRFGRASPTETIRYASVRLQGVAAAYEKFPYPLEELTGQLYFDSDSIIITNVVSQVKGHRIKVDGKVTQRDTPRPMYYISVDGNDVPLDAVLAGALPEHYRKLYQQFAAEGTANARTKIFTPGDGNEVSPVSFLADVTASINSLRPQKLPVTISDVSARMSITPNSLSIKKFAGHYGPGDVSLTGGVRLGDKNESGQTHLSVTAKDVLLDDEIVAVLPESLKEHVAAFHPQGKVNLAVDVSKADSNAPADYAATVECLGNSIRHDRFAYPLRDVRGTVVLKPRRMTFRGLQATPDLAAAADLQSTIRVDGRLDLADESSDKGLLTVTARDVPFTDELGGILSANLAGMYRDLSPRGAFDLDLEIPSIARVAPDEKRLEFRGRAGLKACKLNVSGTAAELSGDLKMEGAYSTRTGLSAGRAQMEAQRLTVKGKPITDVRADIAFDPNGPSWSARDFYGACCGGQVLGSLELNKAGQAGLQYLLQVAFHRVDLQQFLVAGKTGEAAERNYSSGIMDAWLSLGARVGEGRSKVGLCRFDIADMQVGKVSPLANVISVLQLNEPTAYTFDRMLVESCLKQNTLLIQKLDMSGKNVAFTGSGTMDMPSGEVNLALTARGKRVATAEPTVLQSLAEGLGGAVVRMEVTGSIDNPHVETKALPLLEDSLRILGAPR